MEEENNRREIAEYKGRELKEREDYLLSTEVQREYDAYIEQEINLRDYIDVLFRRKWIVLSCLIISFVTVGIASLLIEPIYKAKATIEISPENPKITAFEEVVEVENRQDEYYETQYKLIGSKSLAEKAVVALQLDLYPEFAEEKQDLIDSLKEKFAKIISAVTGLFSAKKKELDPRKVQQAREEELINSFLDRVEVIPDKRSRLVQISFESTDPDLSAKAANTLVDKYVEWVIERKVNTTKAAREFLDKQLTQVKIRLERAEEELGEFAKGVDIFSLEGDKKLSPTYQQLIDLSAALSGAEAERFSKEALYKEVQEGNYEYLPQVINDSSIQTLNEQYTKLKAEHDNMAVLYGPNFPDMKQLAAQIERIQNAINQRISGIAESIKKDYQAAITKEKILGQRIDQQKKLVTGLNEKAIQYRILEREVDTNKSIYESLLQRLKETEVTSGIKATNIQVVDYASIPQAPYKPDIIFNLLLATLVALIGGVFLAFIFEHFDNTIKDEEEVKRRYNIPFLGAVPLLILEENGLQKIEKAVFESPKSMISEAFRVIRTSILYSSPDHPPRSLLVTSTQPLEGKTTSASNLTLSMIQSGLKVVLVDADLRKPRLHKIFLNNGNGFGLSTYLVGKMDLSGVIHRTDVDGLDIISSGPIPPNPAELLGSRKMKELIDRLLEEYDHVILDGPPIAGFADSRLLSRLVDGVLLVTSVGITQRQPLRTSIEEILKVGGRFVGAIVNRLESGRNKYGYGYYYYYNEASDGNYDSVTDKKKKRRLFLKGKIQKKRGTDSHLS